MCRGEYSRYVPGTSESGIVSLLSDLIEPPFCEIHAFVGSGNDRGASYAILSISAVGALFSVDIVARNMNVVTFTWETWVLCIFHMHFLFQCGLRGKISTPISDVDACRGKAFGGGVEFRVWKARLRSALRVRGSHLPITFMLDSNGGSLLRLYLCEMLEPVGRL